MPCLKRDTGAVIRKARTADSVAVRVGDALKKCANVFVRIAGEIKPCYPLIPFSVQGWQGTQPTMASVYSGPYDMSSSSMKTMPITFKITGGRAPYQIVPFDIDSADMREDVVSANPTMASNQNPIQVNIVPSTAGLPTDQVQHWGMYAPFTSRYTNAYKTVRFHCYDNYNPQDGSYDSHVTVDIQFIFHFTN